MGAVDGHDPSFDQVVDALAYVRKDGVWVETGPAPITSIATGAGSHPGRTR